MQACEWTCSEWGSECKKLETLVLLRNQEVQTLFGDNVKIVSITGGVYVEIRFPRPYTLDIGEYGEPATWLAMFDLLQSSVFHGRAGLVKTETTTNLPAQPQPEYNLSESFDWSEGRYIKRWEKLWIPQESFTIQHAMEGVPYGICSDVTKPNTGNIVNALAGGTGNINTETGAISTTCTPYAVSVDDGPVWHGFRHIAPPRPWYINLGSRRPITLKENENLELQMAFAAENPGSDCFPGEANPCDLDSSLLPCQLRFIPNVMLTLQYG